MFAKQIPLFSFSLYPYKKPQTHTFVIYIHTNTQSAAPPQTQHTWMMDMNETGADREYKQFGVDNTRAATLIRRW